MQARKTALITGITGQHGAYLSRFLLDKGYHVHGVKRRSSSFNTARIDDIYQDPHDAGQRLTLHYGDVTDGMNMMQIVAKVRPDEIYNLAAQSHVQVSFELPKYSGEANAMGTLHILEAIRAVGLEKTTRFYQASTSEMFGNAPTPQSETTPFQPASPYAAAKLYAHWLVRNYREAYGMHASSGILFNHESPYRGETFVTRKITRAAAAIKLGLQEKLYLGNLAARRDWGHARDYVRGMWLMLQQDRPDDYVLATGVSVTVREFAEMAFSHIGITLDWRGEGIEEKGYCSSTGKCLVEVDPRYFRPSEVNYLLGNPEKAMRELGWRHEITLQGLAQEMVEADLAEMQGRGPNSGAAPQFFANDAAEIEGFAA